MLGLVQDYLSPSSFLTEPIAKHERVIKMPNIDIYTKAYCPYCTHALALLKSKQLSYNEIKIDGDMNKRSAMIERSNGGYTVPQIFIDDVHVGGCDQLVALERNNQLDALLEEKQY